MKNINCIVCKKKTNALFCTWECYFKYHDEIDKQKKHNIKKNGEK